MTRGGERVAVGALLLVAPLALLVVARQGEFTALAAFSPLFFPRLVLWAWAAFAAVVLAVDVRAYLGERRANAAPGGDGSGGDGLGPSTWSRLAAVALAMGAFVGLVTEIGFVLSGIGFTVAVLLVLGIRSAPTVLAYGTLLPIALFGLFHHGLGLPLPTSPFSHLF